MALFGEDLMEDALAIYLNYCARSLAIQLGREVTPDEALAWAEAIDRRVSAEYGTEPLMRATIDQPRLN